MYISTMVTNQHFGQYSAKIGVGSGFGPDKVRSGLRSGYLTSKNVRSGQGPEEPDFIPNVIRFLYKTQQKLMVRDQF